MYFQQIVYNNHIKNLLNKKYFAFKYFINLCINIKLFIITLLSLHVRNKNNFVIDFVIVFFSQLYILIIKCVKFLHFHFYISLNFTQHYNN